MDRPLSKSARRKSYVEFGGPNDYVNCQSCQGKGIVPKEAQEGLIALIPHDDDRLKLGFDCCIQNKRYLMWLQTEQRNC